MSKRVLVVVSVLLLGATGYLWFAVVAPHARLEQARAEGLAAARAGAEQVLSFGPGTAVADLARARDAVTGAFGDEFRRALGTVVEPGLRRGVGTRTTVTRAGVVSAEPDRVTALLYLSQTVTEAGGPVRVTRSRAEVTVERAGDRWLVADLRNF